MAKAKAKAPERSENELKLMRKAYARRVKRHEPVTAGVRREDSGRLALDVPHDDHRGWLIRLGDAMGTRSDKFALNQLQHLLAMIPEGDPRPDFNANAMLAALVPTHRMLSSSGVQDEAMAPRSSPKPETKARPGAPVSLPNRST